MSFQIQSYNCALDKHVAHLLHNQELYYYRLRIFVDIFDNEELFIHLRYVSYLHGVDFADNLAFHVDPLGNSDVQNLLLDLLECCTDSYRIFV